jgi:hypothetical protein
MPRWFWLLPIAAMAAWWPIGPYWQSDDFIALQYASDLGRASSDLVGKQYGAVDLWAFYRPLITLSFWFDQTIAGIWPPFSHCSNVIAHGISTILVALIWRRFIDDKAAFGAAILWACMPSHSGSIAWAVGRVDSHTTVWCLLAIWTCLRANEQRQTNSGGSRLPMVIATTLALMSKELAFVLPPLCSWLSAIQSPSNSISAKVRDAVTASWPVWLLFALYLPFRWVVLGKFGGYDASSYDLPAMATGLGMTLANLLVPLRWTGSPAASDDLPQWVFFAGAVLPIAIALLISIVRRPRLAAFSVGAFLISVAPMAMFLAATKSPHNLRYYYLPTVALVGLLACSGRWTVVAILLAWLWPFVAMRCTQFVADQQSAAIHSALLKEVDDAPSGPMFVSGLPHRNAAGTAIQLHFGIDRMLQPPFCEPGKQLFALRPLIDARGIVRIGQPDEPPFALPKGSTWWFPNETAFGRITESPRLPELVIEGDSDGILDMSTERLMPLIDDYKEIKATGQNTFGLTTQGNQQPFFRLTIFTACGYLSCICKNHRRPNEAGGRIDVLRLLAMDAANPYDIGRLSITEDRFIGDALIVPTTMDILPLFPTLIEAGSVNLETGTFSPSHRARRLIMFSFDDRYASWVRKAQQGSY